MAKAALLPRLHALDLLRGVAALTVMMNHAPWEKADAVSQKPTHLAVDLFFMLSGFVLARAYDAPLSDGRLSPGRFMAGRLVRLFPLYLLGSIAVAVLIAWYHRAEGPVHVVGAMAPSLALTLAFLPSWFVFPFGATDLYPYNVPAWSLFWELAANLVFAFWPMARRGRVLFGLVIAALAVLTVQVAVYRITSGGWERAQGDMGLGRSFFAFFAGCLLFRLLQGRSVPRVHGAVVSALFLLPVLTIDTPSPWLELATIVVWFPLLIVLGQAADGGPLFRRVADWAGALSYPVYALQTAVMAALLAGWRLLRGGELTEQGLFGPALFFVVTPLAAAIALTVFDAPLRARLMRRLNLHHRTAGTERD